MKRITRRLTWCAIAAAALLLAPRDSRAFDERDFGISDSSSYAEVSAQIGEWVAWSLDYSLDMLGIAEMEYSGAYIHSKDERRWLFETEPEITEVDRDGPSEGVLKRGDVIVAVDGMLITTRRAGVRLANLIAGEPVELAIRRARRERTVTVVPRAVPEQEIPIEFTASYSDRSNDLTIEPGRVLLPGLARLFEQIKSRDKELTAMTDSMGVLASPQYLDRAPRGWIGFGLSFSGGFRRNDEGKPADWLFLELPSIKSIQPGSPADDAGLQVNDLLLEIDGLKLNSERGGRQFSRMEPGQTVGWKVKRGSETFTVETIAAERPRREPSESEPGSFDADTSQPIRYTGGLGDTEIEVRGPQEVRVEKDTVTGEIVIRSGESVVRLKSKDDH
jgi:hypothetical protein